MCFERGLGGQRRIDQKDPLDPPNPSSKHHDTFTSSDFSESLTFCINKSGSPHFPESRTGRTALLAERIFLRQEIKIMGICDFSPFIVGANVLYGGYRPFYNDLMVCIPLDRSEYETQR